MAGPLLNLTIFTKSTPHTLRALSILTFPPAFLLLLIQGIISSRVLPALGILPLFFSSAFAVLLLANERKCGCQSSGLSGTPIHLVFDVLLGAALLVLLILTWVFLPHHYDGGMVMLGTYGTNFLVFNFLVHVYFTAQQLSDSLSPGASYPVSCPQCQYGPFTVAVQGGRAGYESLLDSAGLPRTSVEEERVGGEEAV